MYSWGNGCPRSFLSSLAIALSDASSEFASCSNAYACTICRLGMHDLLSMPPFMYAQLKGLATPTSGRHPNQAAAIDGLVPPLRGRRGGQLASRKRRVIHRQRSIAGNNCALLSLMLQMSAMAGPGPAVKSPPWCSGSCWFPGICSAVLPAALGTAPPLRKADLGAAPRLGGVQRFSGQFRWNRGRAIWPRE